MPGLGEEAPVGEDDLTDPVVGRLLQEHADVMRLVPQPCEERRGRLERPPFDFGVPEVHQAFERFMESEQVAALDASSGRRPSSVLVVRSTTRTPASAQRIPERRDRDERVALRVHRLTVPTSAGRERPPGVSSRGTRCAAGEA